MLKTEMFWSGADGDQYHGRDDNRGDGLNSIPARTVMFMDALRHTGEIHSICELGANIGLNAVALKRLLPSSWYTGLEINTDACDELSKVADVVINSSIDAWQPDRLYDLVFTRGVLIHIHPEQLLDVYGKLYRASGKYIMIAEYHNPTPVEIEYQGRGGLLWKRDFAADMLELYPDLHVSDYGWVWRHDPHWAQDDITWTVLEK